MRRCHIVILILFLLAALAPTASANGMPVTLKTSPAWMAVPDPDTKVGVRSERLTVDFRGAAFNPNIYGPWVTAVYTLENPEDQPQSVVVAFLYLKNIMDLAVSWEGTPVKLLTTEEAPPEWPSEGIPEEDRPASMAWLNPESGQVYARQTVPPEGHHAVLIPLTVPPGAQGELSVRFRQTITGCDACTSRRPFLHYSYLLSPAKFWPSFGDLEITVIPPPGYAFASEPRLPIQEEIDGTLAYRGRFSTLPEGDFHYSIRRASSGGPRLTWGQILRGALVGALAITWFILLIYKLQQIRSESSA
ncbi:MAG: hypothetical protein ACOY93_07680 [Bacillota bacterium]